MVYTTGKIGVDLLTDASDSRSSHRDCLRSAPGPPVKNGLGWWELHKMLGYRYCNFNSKIGLLDVQVITSKWSVPLCSCHFFWYQIHSKSILQPHVIHVIHGQNCLESYGFSQIGTVAQLPYAINHGGASWEHRWTTFKTTLKMAGFLQVSTWPNGRSSDIFGM